MSGAKKNNTRRPITRLTSQTPRTGDLNAKNLCHKSAKCPATPKSPRIHLELLSTEHAPRKKGKRNRHKERKKNTHGKKKQRTRKEKGKTAHGKKKQRTEEKKQTAHGKKTDKFAS
jgi:hypothetical protein